MRLGIVLKQIREKKGLTIMELSKKSGVGNGTIGDIESGKNKSTIKTIEKIAKGLNVDEKERNLLFSAFMPTDIGKKILSKREQNQFEDVLATTSHFFNDENVSDEDKNKMKDALLEAFYDAKQKNKRKK